MRAGGEVGRRARHCLDLVDVDGLEERLAGGEVPVERPDADSGPFGYLLEWRRGSLVTEELACGRDELVAVQARVGALRALRLGLGAGSRDLTSGGGLRIVTGGSLRMFRR